MATDAEPILSEAQRRAMHTLGHTVVVIVNRNVSARKPGSVEATFRTMADGTRFASTLNKTYGSNSYRAARV